MGASRTSLGLLDEVTTYYIEESHGDLPRNSTILSAIEELLETGRTGQLKDHSETLRSGPVESEESKRAMLEELINDIKADAKSYDETVSRIGSVEPASRSRDESPSGTQGDLQQPEININLISRGGGSISQNRLSIEEVRAEESLLRGFIASTGPKKGRDDDNPEKGQESFKIKIMLVLGDIRQVQAYDGANNKEYPIDSISVGHYLGVRPQDAEKALDKAISEALPGKVGRKDNEIAEADLLLTQYTDRGIIRGELGQPFFLADPREAANGQSTNRTIAVAGMGVPGRFGEPELVVTVRELCWSLGRLGKKHLATVLIGSGNGNLSVPDSISGWMRGIKRALSGSPHDENRRLACITFVEFNPIRVKEIDEAIQKAVIAEMERPEDSVRLLINYKASKSNLEAEIDKWNENQRQKQQEQEQSSRPVSLVPTRMTVELNEGSYRFGAITEIASIPQRDIQLDQALVKQANNELAAEGRRERQLERGRLLEGLLIPKDFRQTMTSPSPLVMMLDSTTARIHWEAMAQPEALQVPGDSGRGQYERLFLGTSRGLTRQLRTTFAPPPEPPPPPRRVLHVLVVADPAANAPLVGAEEEGLEVAELFESFNKVWNLPDNRVEVVRLSGPREATRTNVLRELMLRSYDVLHYAGHCFYNSANPTASGWIFGKDEYLTANELNRIDRIPKFVFSNACESGVTPERTGNRSVELAPSFAEAFFKRGVSNFVCTAWPVNDVAARQFAITLYSNLLGLSEIDGQPNRYEKASERQGYTPDYMYEAMRKARLEIADTPNGVQTWGAYQHYGNPYLRFFDWETLGKEK